MAKSKDHLSKAKCDFYDGYRQAKTSLQMTDFLRFSWLLAECDQKQRITNEEKYAKTLKFLRKEREENYSNIINLTDIELTSAQKAILSKGMDFCLPPNLFEEHVFAEFEILYSRLVQSNPTAIPKPKENRCRSSLTEIALKLASSKPDRRDFLLERKHLKALRELKSNDDIIITKPDKGRAVVILPKHVYKEKMASILDGKSKFEKLGPAETMDRTEKIEENLQKYLAMLANSNQISMEKYQELRPTG